MKMLRWMSGYNTRHDLKLLYSQVVKCCFLEKKKSFEMFWMCAIRPVSAQLG